MSLLNDEALTNKMTAANNFWDHLKNSLMRNILTLPHGHRMMRRFIKTYIISYPKCGRTWLRMMLGKLFHDHFGLDIEDPKLLLETIKLRQLDNRIPSVRFSHDDVPQKKLPNEVSADKSMYSGSKVILLVRDPRDAVISNYFQFMKRGRKQLSGVPDYQGDLSSYLRYELGSLDSMIRFYNIWAQNRHVPLGFLLISYEGLHEDTARELRRVLDFIGLDDVDDWTIKRAVEFARFENMRRMEAEGMIDSKRLKPGDSDDPESYKTRRGKVGGYIDYLDPEDIDYLNSKIGADLDSYYGY